jgi:hypothetical protein
MPITAAVILQLLITFGPEAIKLVQNLVSNWTKTELSPEEVNAIIAPLLTKTTADYLAEAGAAARPSPA